MTRRSLGLVTLLLLPGITACSRAESEPEEPVAVTAPEPVAVTAPEPVAVTAPEPVVVTVAEEQMALINSLPDDLVCFTPADNPVQTLEGLSDDQFAGYLTSPVIAAKLMSGFGREETVVGLRFMGTGGFRFADEPELRLFITHEGYADDIIKGGGARIEFRTDGP